MINEESEKRPKSNKIWIITLILFILTYIIVFTVEPVGKIRQVNSNRILEEVKDYPNN